MKDTLDIRSIKKILKKNRYVVDAHAETPFTVRLTLPKILNSEYTEKQTVYQLQDNGLRINQECITLEPYAKRACIIADIIKTCFHIKYNPLFLRFRTNNTPTNETTFFNYLNIKDVDEEKETAIQGLMINFFTEEEPNPEHFVQLADQLNVKNSFVDIIKLLSV